MTDLAIVRMALACPVGLRADTALAALRAGVTRFSALDDDVRVARLSCIAPTSTRLDRMVALVRYALAGALAEPVAPYRASLPVFLALPEPGSAAPFDEASLLGAIQALVSTATGAQAVLADAAVHRSGRAGVFAAIRQAAVALADERIRWALVGAVDSLVDPASVENLAARGLLLGPQNLDGRIPGEACTFFLVTRPGVIDRGDVHATISRVVNDVDPACFAEFLAGKAINRAAGLTRVFRDISRAHLSRFGAVVSAQPGESFWGREFAYAYLRNIASMPEPLRIVACGSDLGDAGAAAGGAALARGIAELKSTARSGTPACSSVLVYAGSDQGALGGCTLLPG